ncbi:MAG: hypothetical protein KKE36_06160 [Actinobacteria bacterium]|nr:hypothetical protein [Actinomycetota bacterium]
MLFRRYTKIIVEIARRTAPTEMKTPNLNLRERSSDDFFMGRPGRSDPVGVGPGACRGLDMGAPQ